MEWVAWASHKYIMHGFAWAWHRDHHEPHDNLLEKNDLFAIVGAVASISMFAIGSPMVLGSGAWWPGTWIGLGILFYGIIYTLVHDGLVHQDSHGQTQAAQGHGVEGVAREEKTDESAQHGQGQSHEHQDRVPHAA